MSTVYKTVDIITNKPIRDLPNPINSSTFGLELSLSDILLCILEKATVLEILPSGKKLKLTLYNYKNDNVLGEDVPPPYDNSVGSFPFISNILGETDEAPYLVTGKAIRDYIAQHGGTGAGGEVGSLDGKTFTDTTGALLRIKRGLKADLAVLKSGEPALALDEKRLYFGGISGALISIPNQADITSLINIIDVLQDLIDTKISMIEGKDLSSNDYTDQDKLKVDDIANKASTLSVTALSNQLASMQAAIELLQAGGGGGTVTPLVINSLTSSVTLAEMGATISSIVFNWIYSSAPTSQQFEGVSLSSALRTYTYTTPVTANKTFTLSAVASDATTKTATSTINFLNGVYYGISTSTTYDNALISSLATKVLSGTKVRTISLDAPTVADYMYYALPVRLGVPVFTVGGFEGGIELLATIPFTNASGYTEDYGIYRSDNGGMGLTTIVIS